MSPDEAAIAVAVGESISRELDEDYVGLWVIPWDIRRRLSLADDDLVREIARAVLQGLSHSAVRIGDMGDGSGVFSPWPVRSGIERALRDWREFGRDPNIGEIAWLARER
ncbi:hypothetical protein [Cellulomonas sp. C5510]|uniref:hypothetical protein n=1 Tax=Cellulomonas sp. C5510 TaxID=2871170 RepID=UPI001C96F799|nr:hypothetical protein [Cellulomonas sp. C5510]QZN84585.1 hypothetical protein K5O09_12090 [Cellulomonas sp. C5510]